MTPRTRSQDGPWHRFEDVVVHRELGDLLEILAQRTRAIRRAADFLVRREDYVYLVPFPRSPQSGRRGPRRARRSALRDLLGDG
jgi:hypothetical protein